MHKWQPARANFLIKELILSLNSSRQQSLKKYHSSVAIAVIHANKYEGSKMIVGTL